MEWSQVSYHYDGSFAGFLCCVFAAYLHREAPACFLGPEDGRFSLWPEREIVTEQARAKRVYQSLDKKIGVQGRQLVVNGFLTCLPEKELALWEFLRLGYERGPDGKPHIVPEQAEIIRFIYQQYLAGGTLRSIKGQLEGQGCLTAAGKAEWIISNIKSILTNEKYCGDALLQKTFIKDCISKQVIPNTGQLPKYLIRNHHEAIVSREMFDAVQLEMARRRAQEGGTKKSSPSGLRKYSGKYALSSLLFCGECGTAYRRCIWTQHGEKRPVWRCVSRLSYGKKYCLHSPTLDEEPLQQAILGAINASMDNRTVLESRITAVMEQELLPVAGETMSLADVERALEDLGRQFDSLLKEAASPERQEEYTERFRAVSTSMAELKNRRERLKAIYQENEKASQRLQAISAALEGASADITEWDESAVYQLLEKVTVLSKDRIRVTFRGGLEIEQNI